MEKRRPFDVGWLKPIIEQAAHANVTEIELTSDKGPLRRVYFRLAPSPSHHDAVTQQKPEQHASYEDETRYHHLKAPLGGIFYRRPLPSEPPFTEEGRVVEVGQPVAMIEAMKVMNHIPATAAGKISQIIAKDGELVKEGATLLIIDKTQTQAAAPPPM